MNTVRSLIIRSIDKIHSLKCVSIWKLLIFFSLTQIVYFFDAGAISGSISRISEELDLSFTQAGKIATFFTIGYILCCPMIGHMETQFSQSTLLACGLFLYILGNSGVASSFSTVTLLISRIIAGFGGAFYASVSLPYVEQIAPPNKKATCLGIFNSSMALGVSLGYVVSGFISENSSWRIPFVGEVFCMVPLFLMCFFIPWNPREYQYHYAISQNRDKNANISQTTSDEIMIDLDCLGKEENSPRKLVNIEIPDLSQIMEAEEEEEEQEQQKKQEHSFEDTSEFILAIPDQITSVNSVAYSEKFKSLIRNPSYVLVVCGNICLMFVINAFSYWSPSFVYERTGMSLEYSNIMVGLTTFITGIFGTILGGIVMDYFGKGNGETYIKRAMIIICCLLYVKSPLNFVIAFVTDVYVFIPLFALSELLLFMTFAPVNKLIMNIVSDDEKTTANSLQLFAVKIFGDILSPPVVGFIRQKWDFTVAVIFLSFIVLVSASFFSIALIHRKCIVFKSNNQQANTIY